MRLIGFSTGALAYADFRDGLRMLRSRRVKAVELSALRQGEIIPLLEAIPSMDLSEFQYVSVHAPSQYDRDWEAMLCSRLLADVPRDWPIVVHPDVIVDFGRWRELGDAVCVENMDKRKPTGRSAEELEVIFKQLPEASLCFDIGHARQFDPTMTEAWRILRDFGVKLKQVHVSEVNTRSKHDPLSFASIHAFQEIAHLIPDEVPLILEAQVPEGEIDAEIGRAIEALPVEAGVRAA